MSDKSPFRRLPGRKSRVFSRGLACGCLLPHSLSKRGRVCTPASTLPSRLGNTEEGIFWEPPVKHVEHDKRKPNGRSGQDLSRGDRTDRRFHPLAILVNLLLQLPQLFQGTFREQRKVAGIAREDFRAVGFQHPLHAAHLLNRLIQLFRGFNHTRTLTSPFFIPGRCLTC